MSAHEPEGEAEKVSFGEMRKSVVRRILVYRSDFRCSYWIEAIGGRNISGSPTLSRVLSAAHAAATADIGPNFNEGKNSFGY